MDENQWIRDAVDRHSPTLLRYARAMLGDADRARDIVQDVFVRLCHARRDRVEPHLAEWLFTVCRNRALDVLRKENRMQPLSELESETLPERGVSPSQEVETRDAASRVLGLLGTLPLRQQELIRLKFQSGLSYEEISRVTQLSVSNVGYLLHTAIRSLRQQMGQEPLLAGKTLRRTP